jgi:hypothetical protein
MKKQKFKTMYMHTLDGEPAAFYPKEKLILIPRPPQAVTLVSSLREIKRHRKIEAECLGDFQSQFKYGYAIIKVPA